MLVLSDPLIVIAPKIDLPSEYTIITENTLVGYRSPLQGHSERQVWEAIWSANHKYPNVSMELLYDMARCESGLRQNVYGDSGKAYGLYQWWQSSWNMYNKKFGTNLDRKNIYDQAEMTARVLSEGGHHNWKRCWQVLAGIQY